MRRESLTPERFSTRDYLGLEVRVTLRDSDQSVGGACIGWENVGIAIRDLESGEGKYYPWSAVHSVDLGSKSQRRLIPDDDTLEERLSRSEVRAAAVPQAVG